MRLIRAYCRESGVRNLQKHIEKVRRSDMKKKTIKYLSIDLFRSFEKLPIKSSKKDKQN